MRHPLFNLAVLGILAMPAAAADARVLSFETDADLANTTLNHSKANVVAVGNTHGEKALQVEFTDANYPGITWKPAEAWDWSKYAGIAVDVVNLDNEPITFALRIDDQPGSDGKVGSRTGAGRLQGLEQTTYVLPFNNDPASPWKGVLPGTKTMRDTSGTAAAFNPGHIVSMNIFVPKPPSPKTLVFDNFRLVQAPADTIVRATEPKLLQDFEGENAIGAAMTNKSTATLVPTGGTQGPKALKVDFQVSEWPNVAFKTGDVSNWESYAGLAMDVTNPSKSAERFAVRIDDVKTVGTGVGWSGTGSIEPGGTASFVVSFGVDPGSLGMQALPPIAKNLRSMGGGGAPSFDFSKIAAYQIFLLRPGTPRTLIVDNIRLVPGAAPNFKNLVDTYGQYTREDGPGKVKSDADIIAARDREAAELKAQPAVPDRDKYGGWSKGPQLKATGFFRTEKYNGKWALVDPDGRLFISLGITTLTPTTATLTTSREYMFTALPANDPMLDKHKGHVKNLWEGPVKEGDTVDFYSANLERKYGADYQPAWQANSLARLPSWGFNTVANFSSWNFFNNGKVPYVAAIWPLGNHVRVPHAFDSWNTMDDPYDPKFAADVAGFAQGIAAKVKDDPYFLGYFVGNEQKWGSGAPRSRFGLALGSLKLKQDACPAKAAFVTQLKEKYVDIAKFNTAWGQNLADWDALAAPLMVKDPFNAEMTADLSGFTKAFALKYFQTVRAELKKLDPNHMYLGVRFAGYTPEAVQACAEATDVMSFNIYRYGIHPEEWSVLDGIDHPIIVGEFHFGATDRGMFHGSLVPTANQVERGKAYEGYVRSIVDHPLFVGCHWFQYVDEPLLGRPGDGENFNCGFVNVTDTPYPELVAAARKANAEVYARRFGK